MSRSFKKHFGGQICSGSDKWWRKNWHSSMRSKERDLLTYQIKYPEEDIIYPIPREVDSLWCAPSDGGSYWQYASFEHYYQDNIKWWYRWRYMYYPYPTREETWKEFIKDYGK